MLLGARSQFSPPFPLISCILFQPVLHVVHYSQLVPLRNWWSLPKTSRYDYRADAY